jgi:ppGpp synthetase/RelA/SpoT-type nucleotidyltranferase
MCDMFYQKSRGGWGCKEKKERQSNTKSRGYKTYHIKMTTSFPKEESTAHELVTVFG